MPCIFKPDMHPPWFCIMPCLWWLFTMLFAPFRCCFLRVGSNNVAFVRTRSTTSVCLLHGLVLLPCGISGKITIYPRYHFYLCLLDARSIAMPMPRYLPHALSCLPYCHVKPLTHLVLANRCLAMLSLCLAPLIALLAAGEDWSLFLIGTCLLLGYHYYFLSILMHLYTW